MRVLLGEPGSGKTTRILEELVEAGGAGGVRLAVPTATMADHLRHEMARRGARVRPSSIVTLSGLAGGIEPDPRVAAPAELALLIEHLLATEGRHLFSAFEGSPGLAPALGSAIEDLANAGCDALTWRSLMNLNVHRDGDLAALYDLTEERLRGRGLLLRPTHLMRAARRIRESGTGLRQVWFDGFFQFSRAELELIRALNEKTQVTVSLPEWEGAAAPLGELRRMGAGEVRLPVMRSAPRVTLIEAASKEREADEIALRILEGREQGRPWREFGIIVRRAFPYVPLLVRTLSRAGVPVRAYFGDALLERPAGAFLAGLAEAALSGWEGEKTLRVLRSPVSAAWASPATDALAAKVRDALPFSGLAKMREMAGPAADVLLRFDLWPVEAAPPGEWARRLGSVSELAAAPPAGRALTHDEMADWRGRAAALRAAAECLESAAALLPPEPVSLAEFWRYGRRALGAARVRVEDRRRDVVHLIDVMEARQWELPVVFVCGLLEGEFPASAAPDPVLPEETRWRLVRQGIPVRTRAGREREEDFLYKIAASRATEQLFLSWPAFDAEGRPALRSFILDDVEGGRVTARRMSIAPVIEPPVTRRPALRSPEILAAAADRHGTIRATAIETFLQCPFQFYASFTLGLEEMPVLPQERCGARFLGTSIHKALAEWHRRGGAAGVEEIFEQVWESELGRARIPRSHRVEMERAVMLRSLRAYQSAAGLRDGWQVRVETPVELKLGAARVKGRADRVDVSPAGECIVYDFKYTGGTSLKRRAGKQEEGLLVQGGLYAAALEAEGLRPAGLFFVGVRDGTSKAGWDDPAEVRERIGQAVEAARMAIERIVQGVIEVEPADETLCGYCSFRDACRIGEAPKKARAAGAAGE